MGGPRLEVVKFGFYVFFPVGVMLYFGGPDFYDKHVKGIRFWPDYETTTKPPTTSDEVKDTLATLKAQREERWRQYREQQQQQESK
ncbi:hypothetical protein BDA99DRAFT_530241 [Phascolomyces articulosus]|uniref:Uncharacterized protein n=1 Tax=Phascolomyces articulosus TaxID=60185 RepID=A0AAD5JK88_9FUNG|nr:hypothetical protein BDA99DRAFT_530241 [Phascolomyces articulosus]